MINKNEFENADGAFAYLYSLINSLPVSPNGTKKLYNVGFIILNPTDNLVETKFRKWNQSYGDREWSWYLSEDRSIHEIKKYAPIWDKMHNGDNIVNSNYGYQWGRNNQLEKVISQLKDDDLSRQAWITIFDGKEKHLYRHDTPCTLNIGFIVENNKLCMTVLMRSNDLWFGFCNDQYCFSRLQSIVAMRLGFDVGWYYHYAADMHLYEQHFNKQ